MPICVTVKHGEVYRHDSMNDALYDYMDSHGAIGLQMWWESDEYTDEEALRDMTNLVAAITSGIKGAFPESEDQDLAHEVLDFIEMSISRRVN